MKVDLPIVIPLSNRFDLKMYSYIGIKQVVFGGSEFESWRENLKTEDTGYTVHKI